MFDIERFLFGTERLGFYRHLTIDTRPWKEEKFEFHKRE